MSNEWSNLSESYNTVKQKHIASVKHKKKTTIYKHIAIKKRPIPEEPEKEEIEVTNEFPILSKYHTNPRSVSFSYTKNCEKYLTWLNSKPVTGRYSGGPNLRATSLEINTLSGRSDLASFLLNSRISLGKKCEGDGKTQALKQIACKALNLTQAGAVFRYFFYEPQSVFNVVVFGQSAPTSECCSVNLIVQVSQEYGGRVICPHRGCVIQYISNFCLDKTERDSLWPVNELEERKTTKGKNSSYSELNPYQMNNGLLFNNITTLNAPINKFSAFKDPLQQLLNHHKRLSY